MQGNIYTLLSDTNNALEYYIQADNLKFKTNPKLKYSIGMIFFHREKYSDAIVYLVEAVNFDNSNIQYRLHLVYIY
jgi:hypothetical protein